MSPFEIEIVLHYWTTPTEYRDGDHTAPAVRETLDSFVRLEVLTKDLHASPMYRVAERGEAYIKALQALPLPVKKWVMPESEQAPSVYDAARTIARGIKIARFGDGPDTL